MVVCLERDLEELVRFPACPELPRRKAQTTNAIERAFRAVPRRVRPMTCFTSDAGCERITYPVLSHLNRSWENHCSYTYYT